MWWSTSYTGLSVKIMSYFRVSWCLIFALKIKFELWHWLYCCLIYKSYLSCITIRHYFYELFNYWYFVDCKIILGRKDRIIIFLFNFIKGDFNIIIFCNLDLMVIWLGIISKGTRMLECNIHLLFLVLRFTDWGLR